MKIKTGSQAAKLRNSLGLSQTEFWARVGSSQSAGSRYELGRRLPVPLQILLSIAYGAYVDAVKIVAGMRNGPMA